MNAYKKAAKNVIDNIERKDGEKFLITAEDSVPPGFPREILKASGNPSDSLMFFSDRGKPNKEPPPQISKAMKECDILVQCISNINLYTKAYLDAYHNGTRIMTMYELDDNTIKKYIAPNDKHSKTKSMKIGNMIENAKDVKLVSDNGTDLTMNLGKRPVLIDDGYMKFDETKGDLMPGCVISVAPIENSVNGILVVDWSINPPINVVKTPVKISFENGKIISITGNSDAKRFISWIKSLDDEKIFFISHLSIGTNMMIKKFPGKYLLDERKDGAITIGLGNNLGPYGGKNSSPNHCDLIMKSAKIFLNGNETKL